MSNKINSNVTGDIALFSVVMPAYNEQDVIIATLEALTSYLDNRQFDYEVIVINDASSDQTESLLKQFEAHNPRVRHINNDGPGGYGHAIRKGLDCYRGEAVAIVTSDGADAPKDIAAYFDTIQKGYDCVFGSRFLPGAKVTGYPRVKLLINRLANRMLALLLRSKYDDFTNGFKCYRRHVIDAMQPLISGQFNITIELAVTAVLDRRNFAVIANDWSQRDAGASSFNLIKLFWPYSMTLLYCLLRHRLKSVQRS